MGSDKSSRASRYQYLLKEIAVEDKHLDKFDNTQSVAGLLNPFKYNEDLLELQDELIAHVWHVIDTECTDAQKEILHMYYEQGMTQKEIASFRHVNQSSVTKSMIGNVDYKNENHNGKLYGGALPKLRKILLSDKIYLNLVQKIADAKEEI